MVNEIIGGWANITTMVKQEKAKNNATWFFDAGDYFTGPYISSLTKGQSDNRYYEYDVLRCGDYR